MLPSLLFSWRNQTISDVLLFSSNMTHEASRSTASVFEPKPRKPLVLAASQPRPMVIRVRVVPASLSREIFWPLLKLTDIRIAPVKFLLLDYAGFLCVQARKAARLREHTRIFPVPENFSTTPSPLVWLLIRLPKNPPLLPVVIEISYCRRLSQHTTCELSITTSLPGVTSSSDIAPKPDTANWPLPAVSVMKKPPLWANSALPRLCVRTFNSTPEVAATKAPSLIMYCWLPTSNTRKAPGKVGDSKQSPSPRKASICCWKKDSPLAKVRISAAPMPPVILPFSSRLVSIITIASDSQ